MNDLKCLLWMSKLFMFATIAIKRGKLELEYLLSYSEDL